MVANLLSFVQKFIKFVECQIQLIYITMEGHKNIIQDNKSFLTDDFDVRCLAFHRVRINLTHVPASIRYAYILYVQSPYLLVAIRYSYPVIFCDHVLLNGQYCLCVHP